MSFLRKEDENTRTFRNCISYAKYMITNTTTSVVDRENPFGGVNRCPGHLMECWGEVRGCFLHILQNRGGLGPS